MNVTGERQGDTIQVASLALSEWGRASGGRGGPPEAAAPRVSRAAASGAAAERVHPRPPAGAPRPTRWNN